MDLIREPDEVDFYVENKPFTEQDKAEISEIIAHYQRTGKKKRLTRSKLTKGKRSTTAH